MYRFIHVTFYEIVASKYRQQSPHCHHKLSLIAWHTPALIYASVNHIHANLCLTYFYSDIQEYGWISFRLLLFCLGTLQERWYRSFREIAKKNILKVLQSLRFTGWQPHPPNRIIIWNIAPWPLPYLMCRKTRSFGGFCLYSGKLQLKS